MIYGIIAVSLILEISAFFIVDKIELKKKKIVCDSLEDGEDISEKNYNIDADSDVSALYKDSNKIRIAVSTLFTILAGVAAFFSYKNNLDIVDIIKVMCGFFALSTASVVDFREKRIPNYIVLFLLVVSVITLAADIIMNTGEWKTFVISYFISGILVFCVLFLLSRISREGIGMGDVKILTALGFTCGMYSVINTLLLSMIFCVLVAMGLIFMQKKKMKDKIAFGPFLIVGYFITIILGAL